MLLDGLVIMALGMGVVFTFLIIMVLSMCVMAKIVAVIGKYFPEKVQEESKGSKAIEQNDEIAVVLAAVKAFG